MRRIFALLLAVAAAFTMTACTHSGGPDENQIPESTGGKDLARAESVDNVFSLNTNPNYSLNPFVATNHSNQLVCDLVYEHMVEVDENFNVIPNVIGSRTTNDNATVWTLTLDGDQTHYLSDSPPLPGGGRGTISGCGPRAGGGPSPWGRRSCSASR